MTSNGRYVKSGSRISSCMGQFLMGCRTAVIGLMLLLFVAVDISTVIGTDMVGLIRQVRDRLGLEGDEKMRCSDNSLQY